MTSESRTDSTREGASDGVVPRDGGDPDGHADAAVEEARAAERDLKNMARGGGLNLIGAVVNQVSLFAITSLIAIVLGKEAVGRYATSYAALSLLGLFSLVGFRAGLTRFVAVYLVEKDPARVRGTVRLGMGLSALSSFLLGGLLFVLAPWVGSRLGDPLVGECLRLTALTLPAATITDAALSGTQGWRTQRPFTYIGKIFEPGARLLLTAGALLAGMGLIGAMWALVIANWIAAALACLALLRRLRKVERVHPIMPVREIFSFSMVSWVSAMSSTGLIWTDTLLLTAFTSPGQVGVYNVATRIVNLAVFVMAPINAAFAPQIAHLHAKRDIGQLERNYRSATTWIVRLALPAFVILLVFPTQLLQLFGKEFSAGALVTVLLGIGQLVNATTGPCGTVLNMSGRVLINMFDNLGALALDIVLNLILIPKYGIVGAAISWAVSLAVLNIVRLVQVKRIMGITPFDGGIVKALGASMVAGVLAAIVGHFLSTWWLALVVGSVLVAVTYPVLVWRLGVSKDDLHVMSAVVGRRTRGTNPPAGPDPTSEPVRESAREPVRGPVPGPVPADVPVPGSRAERRAAGRTGRRRG